MNRATNLRALDGPGPQSLFQLDLGEVSGTSDTVISKIALVGHATISSSPPIGQVPLNIIEPARLPSAIEGVDPDVRGHIDIVDEIGVAPYP
jgi:hypothetical protein